MIEDLKKRIYRVIPSGSVHMIELLHLMDIRYSAEIDTACVTCTSRPVLLLNEKFVNEYCKTDEHLFMLIMHELYHIILGHTKLFTTHTIIDNIAFDAIINAILCRTFNDEEYVSFFTSINSDKYFPSCLLRPIGRNTKKEYKKLLKRLYESNKGTYYEVYEAIIDELKKIKIGSGFILIGDHKEDKEVKNPILKKMIEDLISKWPRELLVNGRDLGDEISEEIFNIKNTNATNKKKMIRLLKKTSLISGRNNLNKRRLMTIEENQESFLINVKDRRFATKKELYGEVILYDKSFLKEIIKKDEIRQKAFVYLDVSGSLIDEVDEFISLLIKPIKNKLCRVFSFSTKVTELSKKQIKEKHYSSTGGTDINCIFDHYFKINEQIRPNKILIITDGVTGKPSNLNLEKIKEDKVKIFIGYTKEYSENFLKDITTYKEVFN